MRLERKGRTGTDSLDRDLNLLEAAQTQGERKRAAWPCRLGRWEGEEGKSPRGGSDSGAEKSQCVSPYRPHREIKWGNVIGMVRPRSPATADW